MNKRLLAEFLGTFWLVFCGCGTAIFSASVATGTGPAGLPGIAAAFGLALAAMAYAFSPVSGAHFNPAVTVGLGIAGKFERSAVLPYILSQTVAGIAAAILLYLLALSGTAAVDMSRGFAANGYGVASPGGFSWGTALGLEVILTAGFVLVIASVTSIRSLRGFAPLVIGLTLALANLVAIPVTNASINPARSTGPALVAGGIYLSQLWLFWLAPLLGGVIGGALARVMTVEVTPWGTGVQEETTAREEAGARVANY